MVNMKKIFEIQSENRSETAKMVVVWREAQKEVFEKIEFYMSQNFYIKKERVLDDIDIKCIKEVSEE